MKRFDLWAIGIRKAYTLLELMLALALLGALMAVAWSLMGTFRDAEQRGWKLAHRTQTIRAAREWLQTDVQHLLQSQPTAIATNTTESRLVGNSLGFTATIAPSLDPLPFLQILMSDPLDRLNSVAEETPLASLTSDTEASDTEASLADARQSLWPAESIDIEYQLEPIAASNAETVNALLQSGPPEDIQFSVTRRERLSASGLQLNVGSLGDQSLGSGAAERVLTAQDLYRQTDESTQSTGPSLRENRLNGLVNAQFQYFDGETWQSTWNSDQAGALPHAIALSFDFPARADMKPYVPNSSPSTDELDSEALLDSRPSESQISFADSALAAEPAAELATTGEAGLMQAATHEVQIIVYIGGRSSSDTSTQAFAPSRNLQSPGGFE